MNKYANSTSPLPDELLYSVLLRNAFANGLSLLGFLNILTNKEKLRALAPTVYDTRIEPAIIIDALGWNYDPAEFYIRHSMLCGYAPFQRYSETSHDVAMFNNRPELGLTPRNSFITSVRFCPKCIEEDTVAYGMYYIHRSHQMPGARTCWRHSVPLFTYSGPIGNELNGNIVPTAQEIVSDDTSYAVFAKDFLDKMHSISIREIKEAIRSKAMDLYHCDWDKLSSDAGNLNGHLGLLTKDAMERRLSLDESISIPEEMLGLLHFLYGSVESIPIGKGISMSSYNHAIKANFDSLSKYRDDLVTLECKTCRYVFTTTPHRIVSGWGCPICDSAIPHRQLMERLVSNVEPGENGYDLVDEPTGNSSCIILHHRKCNKDFIINKREFFDYDRRCSCEYSITEQKARNLIEATGDYTLIKYTNTNEPVTIRHNGCGREFNWNYHKFLKQPWCKLCNPKEWNERDYIQAMADIAGTDYVLLSPYIDRYTKITIGHELCGHTTTMKPSEFLRGRRCQHCGIMIKPNVLAKSVNDLSNGRFKMVANLKGKNAIFRDTLSNKELSKAKAFMLQELTRPTRGEFSGDKLLPEHIDIKHETHLDKDKWVDAHRDCTDSSRKILPVDRSIQYDWMKITDWIQNNPRKIYFLEDMAPDVEYVARKNGCSKLIKDGDLKVLLPGIYTTQTDAPCPSEIIEERYLRRNGHTIGYLAGASFAYSIGLLTNKPKTFSIVTNKEAGTHGRSIKVLGEAIKIHGCNQVVDDNNHAILATISFLLNWKRQRCVDDWVQEIEVIRALYGYLKSNSIAPEAVIPYITASNASPKMKVKLNRDIAEMTRLSADEGVACH